METETEELDEGSVIGNYRVVRLLGQGGMGTVYEVEHLELGTHYALKTFTFDSKNAASQALKAKFLEEGKLLARLKHPNLTHVFDLGFEEKTQMPYFVMDLVTYEDGETYTVEDIDLGDIDEELVYKWFGQLASALDYIHGEGIVHRDIKPSNLLVDADLNVILTDFGISRIFGEKIKEEVDATQTMVAKTGRGKLVLGTEHYIAPEVAKGEEATPRADAYSLGVMLLRWLTGFYYGDNPGAIAMLSGKKYRWLGVIAKLVAPAGRRPENYTELVKLLKVNVQAKPEETERRKRARKKRNAIQNLIAVALGLAIAVGIAAGGYCLWRHFERLNVERDQKFAALQRQIREKDEAEARAKAEAEAARKAKVSEESRLAEEKRKAREAKPAPTLVETHQETLPVAQDRRNEKPVAEKAEERDAQESRPKIVAETVTPAPVDYGPIPNVRYLWHDKRDATKPLQVRFQLANGATMDLMPMKKGSFFMSNCQRDVKSYHKVTFSYDYWMSKHLVTADQWRDFGPFDCEDCRSVEKLVPTNYPVCKEFTFHSITSYCHYLTQRYKAQLPEGYEFRLPTEAELEYAAVGPFVMHDMYDDQYRSEGVFACGNFSALKSSKGLDVLGKWNPNGLLAIKGSMVHVRGLAKKFPTGVFDCWFDAAPVIDEWLGKDFDFCVNYEDAEDDPLHIRGDGNSSLRSLRQDAISRWANDFVDVNFRIVLAIRRNLLKIYKEDRIIQVETKKIPERKYDWAVPHKLSHPKELKFKLANGAEMVFCACPAGKFVMSNVRGQAKNGHQVTITRPFWMTKYFVTAEQWRDFSKYDCEGLCRKIEKAFSKYPVSCAFKRFRWMAFCDYLTKVYGAQLPKGYVFRLPTEAEWEYAFTGGDGFSLMKKNSLYGSASGAGAGRFLDIVRNLQRKEKWIKDLNWTNENNESQLDNEKIYIGGWSAPHAWGIYDLSTWSCHVLLDTLVPLSSTDPCQALNYADREIDPLRWAGTNEKCRCVFRNANDNRGVGNDNFAFAHIVVGPDLIAEKAAAKGVGVRMHLTAVCQSLQAKISPSR